MMFFFSHKIARVYLGDEYARLDNGTGINYVENFHW